MNKAIVLCVAVLAFAVVAPSAEAGPEVPGVEVPLLYRHTCSYSVEVETPNGEAEVCVY